MSDIKDIAARCKATLKTQFPECVFSVTISRYSGGQSMTVRLLSAPFPAFSESDECNGNYAQLNHYRFNGGRDPEHSYINSFGKEVAPYTNNGAVLTKECWELMGKVTQIALAEHWDKSDVQSDYFHCAFYLHLEIGKWDKPFVQKGQVK